MPTITKQTSNRRLNSDAIADASDIRPLIEMKNIGLKFNIYGRSKTGKTRLASTFPKPLLILGTENGTASIKDKSGIDFVAIDHCESIFSIVSKIKRSGKWKTVVLDTATKLRDLKIKEILNINTDIELKRGWGMASRDQWGECAMTLKEILRPLFDLADKVSINFVIISQEDSPDEKVQIAGILPRLGNALGESLNRWVCAESDYICQTFIRNQVTDVKKKIGSKEVTMAKDTGKMEYCLKIGPDPVYITGFRSPLDTLPDVIIDPDYQKLSKLVIG